MNSLPRFQSLPVEVPLKQFNLWDKLISWFIWNGRKPRIRYLTLQLPKDKGGVGGILLSCTTSVLVWLTIQCYMERYWGCRSRSPNPVCSRDTFGTLTGILNTISSFTQDLWFWMRIQHSWKRKSECWNGLHFIQNLNQVSMIKHLWNVLSLLCPGLIASRNDWTL